MQAFAVILAVVAAASASPQVFLNGINGLGYSGLGYGYPYAQGLAYNAAVAPLAIAHGVTKTQYHSQDEFGQASFGHSEPTQAHAAVRDAAGGVRGTFSYISPEGKTLTTHYVADHNGYRVASNALPVGPSSVVPLAALPQVPQDTPEVTQAKIAHFAAVAEAQARSGRKKRALVSPFGYSYGVPSGYGYSTAVTHYAGVPALTYAASPALTYAASPALTYGAAPVHYSAVSHIAAPPAVTYAASPIVAAQAVREATLTKVVNTPGHAVSYRVD